MTGDQKDALEVAYRGFTQLLEGVELEELYRPSRCAGWAVVDVVVHVLADAQRALVTLASPTGAEPETDAVSYWTRWRPGSPQAAASARFTRIVASAYTRREGLLAHWRDTSEAAIRAASASQLDQPVTTQGHVLRVDDFLDTLTVEATIHYLDATVELAEAPPPEQEALAVVRRTLGGLLRLAGGAGVPAPPTTWDDVTYALKATGRLPLSDQDQAALGPTSDRFPLFG